MSRQHKLAPPPGRGIAHRLHTIRSFSEQAALGDFSSDPAPTPTLSYIYYSRGNVIYRCASDLSGHETIYTWTGETEIVSLATIHSTEKIVAMGINTDSIITIDYDGSNKATLWTNAGKADYDDGVWVDETNEKIWAGTLGLGLISMDFDGSNLATLQDGNNNWNKGVTDYEGEYYWGNRALATDTILRLPWALGGSTVFGSSGLTAVEGMAYDKTSDRIWWAGSQLRFSPVSGYALNTFHNPGTTFREMGFDALSGNLYVMAASGSQITRNGFYLYTDADQDTTAHGTEADHQFGDLLTNHRGMTLVYSSNPEAGAITTGSVTLEHTIPAGAYVVRVAVKVIEGFQGDTTAVAVIGDDTDEDRYVAVSFDVKSANPNGKAVGKPSGKKDHPKGKKPKVKVTAGNAFGNLTGGIMLVTVYYIEP